MIAPEFGEGLQRSVLAAAIRTEFLSKLNAELNPDLFGPSSAGSPRRRMAEALLDYWREWRDRPTAEVMDELVKRVGDGLSAPERAALEAEWTEVIDADLSSDQGYLVQQTNNRIEFMRLKAGMEQAIEILERDPDAIQQAKERLFSSDGLVVRSDRLLQFAGGFEERIAAWATGDEYGERIPTGLSVLDRMLNGGPTRKETWYFLAPPKGAKTTCLLRVAAGALRRGFGVYLATFEMQASRMMFRFDRQIARKSKEELQEDQTPLRKAFEGIMVQGGGELWIEEKLPQQPGSVRECAARIERIRKEGGKVDVVCLDYLNIMGASKGEREKRHELARVSRDMAAMAKDLDVLIWSAALVNRKAVNKAIVRKTDIAEAFEVIAVLDGAVAICATPAMVQSKYRRLFIAAAREEQDEAQAGDYEVDFERMIIDPTDPANVEAVLLAERNAQQTRGGNNGGDQG